MLNIGLARNIHPDNGTMNPAKTRLCREIFAGAIITGLQILPLPRYINRALLPLGLLLMSPAHASGQARDDVIA
jgi:hypothetical protein